MKGSTQKSNWQKILADNQQEILNAVVGRKYAKSSAERLAAAVAEQAKLAMKLNPNIRYGMLDGARRIVDIEELKSKLDNPLNAAGKPVVIDTRESYEIYNCLKNMPRCIESMEITRGDKDGVIGTNRPLENTICVAIHHVDDKTYGGLCVLREWGATEMHTIFVGYNPLQTMIWRDMLRDIPDELFTSCILESKSAGEGAPSWAEGIYQIAESFNKFPASRQLPSKEFNRIFDGTDKEMNSSGEPLPFLDAQRSLSIYNFLRALAQGRREGKQVFIWEDGGYLNPVIDQGIEDNITIEKLRSKYMVPEDDKTDDSLETTLEDSLKDHFIGTVELTRNGYDMSAAIAESREQNRMNTNFFSIAASYEKIMLEGDSITLACLDALSQVLYSTGCSLRNRNVLVMGARGNLGRLSVNHLNNILESSSKQLWGCDLKLDWPAPQPDTIPQWAAWSACNVPLQEVLGESVSYEDIPEAIRYDFDVIFGWTGGPRTVEENGNKITYQTITGQNVADWMTKGQKKASLYLASGSTKTVEFSDVLTWLEAILNQPEGERSVNGIHIDDFAVGPIPDELSIAAVAQMWQGENPPSVIDRNFGTQFTFVFKQNGVQVTKTLYLANNTMPINFMYYGTPTEIMDMTYSQVTSCAAAMMNNRDGEPGIYAVDYSKKASDGVYLAQELDKEYPFPPSP